jgi:Ca-activated chloride channel family protein
VGLITFGQQAYLHVPLTLDTLSVSKMLNDTVSGMAGQGTAIGDAIGLGVRTLRDRPEGSRILILLTDGEDNASRIPPMEAAKLAKEYGIKVYTIGIGKQGLVPYPTRGGYGLVETKMDEDLLKNISAMTGGHYFSAADPNSLKSTYEKINELEKTESNMSVHFIREPLYRMPLVMALGLLFILTFYLLILYRRPVSGTE